MLLQFFRFASVGLIATIIHAAIVFLLVEGMDAEPVLATLPAFLTALLVAFFLNRNWTFIGAQTANGRFLRYLTVALGGMLLNVVIMYITVHIAHGSYLAGLALVVTLVPLASFLLQRNWTFGQMQ